MSKYSNTQGALLLRKGATAQHAPKSTGRFLSGRGGCFCISKPLSMGKALGKGRVALFSSIACVRQERFRGIGGIGKDLGRWDVVDIYS